METRDLFLTEREQTVLHALLNDSSSRARRRARIVVDWAEGKDKRTLARELDTRHAYISRITDIFQEKRLDIFSAAARKRVSAPDQTKPSHEKSPLTAQSSMRDAARQILAHQFSKLKQVEDGVRTANDVEAVHDMRVACRRMNSAFRLFKKFLPNKRVKKLRPVLERLRDALGAARNLDVLRADLETYLADASEMDHAQLQGVADAWRDERAIQQHTLVGLLDSAEYAKWRERMDAFLDEDENDSPSRIAEVLPALLWKQYGAVRAYEAHLDDATLEELHALRIDIKRLRYTLEFFADVFEEKPNALIEPLVALQDQLGLIQDAVIAGQALTDFIAAQARQAKKTGHAISDFQAIALYHAHLHSRIEALRTQLPQRWNAILSMPFREQLADAAAIL